MEIVFVCPFGLSPKYTSSGRALPLAQALAQRGHHVRVVIPPWDQPADSGRSFEQDGVQVEHVKVCGMRGLGHAAIVGSLLRTAVRTRSDVIHVFKPKGYSGCVAFALWHLRRTDVVRARIVLDTDDWEGTGGWNERGGYGLLARRLFAWQEHWGLTHCDAVTAASRTLQSLAWACGAPRVRHVPNGLTALPARVPRTLARAQLGLAEHAPLALVYTRFVEIGPDHLAELLQAIAERIPSLHLLVVGRGLGDELARLRGRAAALLRGGRLRLAGWVERERLSLNWSAADFALYACEDELLTRAKSPLRLVEMRGVGTAGRRARGWRSGVLPGRPRLRTCRRAGGRRSVRRRRGAVGNRRGAPRAHG